MCLDALILLFPLYVVDLHSELVPLLTELGCTPAEVCYSIISESLIFVSVKAFFL